MVIVVGFNTSERNPFLSVTFTFVKLELVKVLGGLPMFEIVQLKAPVGVEIRVNSAVTLLPLIEHATSKTLVTPVQFITELLLGGVNSKGRSNETLSPFAIVKLL